MAAHRPRARRPPRLARTFAPPSRVTGLRETAHGGAVPAGRSQRAIRPIFRPMWPALDSGNVRSFVRDTITPSWEPKSDPLRIIRVIGSSVAGPFSRSARSTGGVERPSCGALVGRAPCREPLAYDPERICSRDGPDVCSGTPHLHSLGTRDSPTDLRRRVSRTAFLCRSKHHRVGSGLHWWALSAWCCRLCSLRLR